MKEDILEQIVENWLLSKPATFVKSNVRYKPSQEAIKHLPAKMRSKYTVHSDIDIIAVELLHNNFKKVTVVNCKSWQHGFHVSGFFHALKTEQDKTLKLRKHFKEFLDPYWSEAFREKILSEINCSDVELTYYIAVTKLIHIDALEEFENDPEFLESIRLSPQTKVQIKFIDLATLIKDLSDSGGGTVLESTEMGRMLQLIRAANMSIEKINE